MSTVATILRHKGCGVVTIAPETTVLEAARVMNSHHIGSLVVVTGAAPHTVIGIVTERDVLVRIVAAGRDPRRTSVREVMTTPVTFCTPATSISDLRETMKSQRIRHVPVWCDDVGLCGLVSIGDLNADEAESMVQTIHALEDYIVRG